MIEEHLDDIVSDVKQNLTSLFSRGEQFNELTEKSENLKTHVSTAIFPQTDLYLTLISLVNIVINYAQKSPADSNSE